MHARHCFATLSALREVYITTVLAISKIVYIICFDHDEVQVSLIC
jgi:hypothetical protein